MPGITKTPRTVSKKHTGKDSIMLGIIASAAAGFFMHPVAAVVASFALKYVPQTKNHFSPYGRSRYYSTRRQRLFGANQKTSATASPPLIINTNRLEDSIRKTQ